MNDVHRLSIKIWETIDKKNPWHQGDIERKKTSLTS